MGRRKIEIKAIKDDRNRSVTFLKRKGGLFKKAHELSVLCSVDVAVIIFGHNKKLYEFSSGDINETIGRYQYYGGAHEHKGPEDFMGKKDMDDDDEDDEGGSPPQVGSRSPPEHAMMPHHLANQPQFAHMRQVTPSASPPMPNGIPFHARNGSPQPHGISRPNSRAHIRRNSNLGPHHQSPAPQQHQFTYVPNPPFYNPNAPQGMQPKMSGPPNPSQYQYAPPPPPSHVQQFVQTHERRQSMPPAVPPFVQYPHPQPSPQPQQAQAPPPQQPAPTAPMQSHPQPSPPLQQAQAPPPAQQQATTSSPPQFEEIKSHNQFTSPPIPQPRPLPASKKHSIFTPIDESRSMLASWGGITETPRTEPITKAEPRSQSIDVGAVARQQANGITSQPQTNGHTSPKPPPPKALQRTPSAASVPSLGPPSRTNSMSNDPRRPRLKVQIPSEPEDNGSNTGGSSPKDNSGTSGPSAARTTEGSHSSGVHLPPPSPSASALLSAGATGPPNPFARPPPPGTFGRSENMETPLSALPSRFMEGNMLPSPSSMFYSEWGFGKDSNMLPSPMNYTPMNPTGSGWRDDDDRKRKTSDNEESAQPKRIKA